MASNYPPGVTGNEYAIAGADEERELCEDCPSCGAENALMEEIFDGQSRDFCFVCNYAGDWKDLDIDFDEDAVMDEYYESKYGAEL